MSYKLRILITLIVSVLGSMGLKAQNIDNPVITGIADCGVIRWAGNYYIGGVSTFGDFLISNDLVHWDQRVHAFDLDNEWTHGTRAKNNQIHANDMTYIGGRFHLLFSVNYWGNERHIVHITHAEADTPEGPYKEVRDDHWFENRIDPMAFQDENGNVYLYMVKFTDGNVIWGRPMNEKFEFTGDAREMFTSRPNSWERMDNKVIEGPFVIKHHGQYYMMYNTNHTSVSYGNYRLGVAQSDFPLGFNEGNKYPWPVVEPNEKYITPGQPNIVRGPNGFEWWLVYMANARGSRRRSQFIDRVHFVDGRLTVDAINGKDSPGYHPIPAKPLYEGKEMIQLEDSESYLLEITMTDDAPVFGVRAFENGKTFVDVGIDSKSGKGFIRSRFGRKTLTEEVALPFVQDPGRPHLWRIENNYGTISAWIDGILLCDHKVFGNSAPGHPSLLNKDASIDYVTYTIGWDEWGKNISGWDTVLPKGSTFKGPEADGYEFSTLLRGGKDGRYGIYAAYSGPQDYCKVTVDPSERKVIVVNMKNGVSDSQDIPLRRKVDIYPDPKHSDSWEKQYHFPDGEVCLDALDIPHAEFESKDSLSNEDPASLFQISYLSDGKWIPLEYSVADSEDPAFQRIHFKEIRTKALSFFNRNPKDPAWHISGLKADVTCHDAWQFRAARDNGMLYIHLDNRLIYQGPATTGPSRIGVVNDGSTEVLLEDSLYYSK